MLYTPIAFDSYINVDTFFDSFYKTNNCWYSPLILNFNFHNVIFNDVSFPISVNFGNQINRMESLYDFAMGSAVAVYTAIDYVLKQKEQKCGLTLEEATDLYNTIAVDMDRKGSKKPLKAIVSGCGLLVYYLDQLINQDVATRQETFKERDTEEVESDV
jgi:hypothetical protein